MASRFSGPFTRALARTHGLVIDLENLVPPADAGTHTGEDEDHGCGKPGCGSGGGGCNSCGTGGCSTCSQGARAEDVGGFLASLREPAAAVARTPLL